jgi:anaerobic selenocysteine-containing dehydrogenase
MPDRLTRREFLKVGAMAAAATVVSGCTGPLQRTEYLESYVEPPEEGLPGENLWYASTCRQCLSGCGIIVRVSNGRPRKIEGNPLHPLNRGKLCARGQAALQELYDPDRLRNAVRQPVRGSQAYEPLPWDEAVAELSRLISGTEPASIAFLVGNSSSHLRVVANRFANALGARTPVVYTLGDELSGHQTLSLVSEQLYGVEAVPLFDIARADVVFSFGANFLETWLSPVHYSRAYAQMRRGQLGKRGYLVQFEPRLSSTAASADEWVPIRPGSEELVALGLGKIAIEEGLLDGGQYAAFYERVSVPGVIEASGVPADDLERLARIFAAVPSQVAIPGGTVAGQRNGAAALTAVLALNQIAGQLGRPGGVYLPAESTVAGFGLPLVSAYADVKALINDMDAGRVDLLLVHCANPVFELPAASGFREALAKVASVVSFNPAVDETAVWADLILPDHTNLEAWGYHVPAVADRALVSALQPVTRPIYDTRATVDVLLALARELGGDVGQALPWPNEVDFLREAVGVLRDEATPAESFWAEWRRRGGLWPEEGETRSPSASQVLDAPATPAAQASTHDAADYPFLLHVYPSLTLFDGRGANKTWLQESPDPMTTISWQTWIEINPTTAEVLGVQDNDIVRVVSPVGEVEAIVYVYGGIGEGTVGMPIGQGHENYGRYAMGHGSNPAELLLPNVAEYTGALTWAVTPVQVVPTGTSHDLARLESAEGMAFLREAGEH